MIRTSFAAVVALWLLLAACSERSAPNPAVADTAARRAAAGADSAGGPPSVPDTAGAPDSAVDPAPSAAAGDSGTAVGGSSAATESAAEASGDTLAGTATAASRRPGGPMYGRYSLTPADSALWPVKGPEPLPGALLPRHRIVAYYGNPLSTRMGILGQIPPDEMLARLERTAAEWQAADSTTTVKPALHLIATVAQGRPGPDGKYRLRMPDSLIERVAGWAEQKGWLLFLDLQVGQSTVEAELPRLLPYLQRPYVHLALDPEFAMKGGARPGRKIGTLDAAEINYAIRTLAELVDRHALPPKVLVVHRFTRRMLTNYDRIELDPRVQVVIDMDGFGPPANKKATYRDFVVREPVQFSGFKLFYRNDKPLMTPREVLELYPRPVYIQYQ